MTQIVVRNLDETTLETLKRRARRAGRSLPAEAKAILEAEARSSGEQAKKENAWAEIDRLRKAFSGGKMRPSLELIHEAREE